MAHYAILDDSNVVTFVHPGKDEGEDGIDWEDYYGAVRCSYNTRGGVHQNGGAPFRYNFPSPGWTFHPEHGPDGAFVPPQPFSSWVLNPDTALWDAPVSMPAEGGPWVWDESTLSWVPLT